MMRPVFRALQLFTVLLLTTVGGTAEERVEFVVGELRTEEGGSWDTKKSPLKRPFGIAFNSKGIGFVVELEGGRVFELSRKHELSQISGDGSRSYEGDGQPATKATYNGMHNCAITPNGDLLIGDTWNHCVRRIDARTGLVSTWAGNGKAAFAGDGRRRRDASFNFVMCITLNADSSALHIADLKNRRIRAVDVTSGIVTTVAGNGEKGVPADGARATEAPLVDPRAVAADSKGQVYILERGGNALRVVRTDGTIKTVAGTGKRGFADGPALQAQFGSPKHICVDSRDNVYIADDQNGAIRKYDAVSQTVSTVLGRGIGHKQIRLLNPHGVCVYGQWLYVMDTSHNRILRVRL